MDTEESIFGFEKKYKRTAKKMWCFLNMWWFLSFLELTGLSNKNNSLLALLQTTLKELVCISKLLVH